MVLMALQKKFSGRFEENHCVASSDFVDRVLRLRSHTIHEITLSYMREHEIRIFVQDWFKPEYRQTRKRNKYTRVIFSFQLEKKLPELTRSRRETRRAKPWKKRSGQATGRNHKAFAFGSTR